MTIRAAVRRVVNFEHANINDVNWWRRSNLLILEMARQDAIQGDLAILIRDAGLLGNSDLEKESFEPLQKAATAILQDIHNKLMPWSVVDSQKRQEAEVNNLIAMYKKYIGDPDDPEFKAKMAAEYAKHQAEKNQPVPETDEERLNRLMQERNDNYTKQVLTTQG